MLAKKHLVASTLLALSMPVLALPTTLSFEDAPLSPLKVLESYAALGIHFVGDAWAAASQAKGGYGNFYAAPGDFYSNLGAVTLTANPLPQNGEPPSTGPNFFTVTVDQGFDGFFSLRYTGEADTTITLYDKAGRQLGLALTGNAQPFTDCEPTFSCNWNTLKLDLTAAAYSIKIEGINGKQWFDDFSFGRLLVEEPGGNVPEPGGMALSLAALGALVLGRRRGQS